MMVCNKVIIVLYICFIIITCSISTQLTIPPDNQDVLKRNGMVLEVKLPIKNFWFLDKNYNIWHWLFYHSFSVISSITKTAKGLGKHIIQPVYHFKC